MIFKTAVLAACCFFMAIYPKRSWWDIEKCEVVYVSFLPSWSTFSLVVSVRCKIAVDNRNLLGAHVNSANFELYYVNDMASRSRNNRFGIAEIEGINILGRNSHVLTSRAKITNLNFGELYNLLLELWKSNGRLVVVAIGVARVKALNSLPVIVNIVCKEDIPLTMFFMHESCVKCDMQAFNICCEEDGALVSKIIN